MFHSQYVQPNVTTKCTGRRDRDKLVRVLLYKVNEFAGYKQAPADSPALRSALHEWNLLCSSAEENELCVSTRLSEGQGPNTERTKAGF